MQDHENLRLLQRAPALIWRADTNAKCYWFNETWLSFTGRTMAQEAGDGWAEGVHPDDFDRCLDIFLTSFAQRRAFEMEYRVLRHDGVYRWILDHGLPFETADGVFDGYVGYCFDISDRKIMEQSLLERSRELEVANEEMRRARKSLELLALYDNLTGLANRHNIIKRFELELAEHRRLSSPFSLLIIDVDHCKAVNDSLGHLVGDACLKGLADQLRLCVHASDILGRFGGEEFIVLLPHTDRAGASATADKLCHHVKACRFDAAEHKVELTISIGGVTLDGGQTADFKQLVSFADAALYRAKAAGRDTAIMVDAAFCVPPDRDLRNLARAS